MLLDFINLKQKRVMLGHNRLSILDLSKAGNQPMQSDDKRYIITFNGEIYNFQKLRKELIKKGYNFRTKTDTEVILIGYQYWKEKILFKLNGMFAFCIYDSLKNSFL